MEPKLKINHDGDGENFDSTEYRRVVGCLSYLKDTRPDISYAVGIASHFMEQPTTLYFQVVKHILRYVKGTIDYGLNCGNGREVEDLVGFSDSDHDGDKVGGNSTSGMIFYLGRNAVTWQSQKQRTVALSTCEVELMAATSAACQGIWNGNITKDLTGHHGCHSPYLLTTSQRFS
ncbi:secreted RxLR effector protein 161-like [Lactuca sativa]|uniref:secreted RxLR effector protein 161-like n=1 Tax=Lactuca sativa TaxID=4236 RepID=UPI000CD7F1F9|nr:secreted RxLR effector protein 161-like [Lactuca sativa]